MSGEGGNGAAGASGSGGPGGAAGGDGQGAIKVAVGADHSCAWAVGGRVQCWGKGDFAQIGKAVAASPKALTVLDAQNEPLSGVRDVALGNRHSCAVSGEGGVLCWGDNSGGQVGSDPLALPSTAVPTRVRDGSGGELTNATRVALGDSHGCALGANGVVFCWGNNDFGQLGSRDFASSPLAQAVVDEAKNALVGVTQIAAGDFFNCALTDTGKLYCWGQNSFGQLGAQAGGASSLSHAVEFLPESKMAAAGVEQIAAGGFHACARVASGRVRCWGADDEGQLGGLGAGGSPPSTLVAVATAAGPELEGTADLALGTRHACVLSGGGRAACWGRNASGELGDGTTTATRGARAVLDERGAPAEGARQISLGGQHSCVSAASTVYCWGSNEFGQLGRESGFGGLDPALFPVPIDGALDVAP